jgi:hypothetical protein
MGRRERQARRPGLSDDAVGILEVPVVAELRVEEHDVVVGQHLGVPVTDEFEIKGELAHVHIEHADTRNLGHLPNKHNIAQ